MIEEGGVQKRHIGAFFFYCALFVVAAATIPGLALVPVIGYAVWLLKEFKKDKPRQSYGNPVLDDLDRLLEEL